MRYSNADQGGSAQSRLDSVGGLAGWIYLEVVSMYEAIEAKEIDSISPKEQI